MKLILGSQSKPRQRVLKKMGYDFEVVVPDIDEKAIRNPDPKKLVIKVANAKADDIIKKVSKEVIVITGDSVTVVNREIREKPETKEQAYTWLKEISQGVRLTQVSSVVVTNTKTNKRVHEAQEASVIFKDLPEQEVKEFVESGDVFNFAGAYAIEFDPFKSSIKELKGEMETIIGLPKELTKKLLKEIEYK